MKLNEVFAAMVPLLSGRAGAEETARALYDDIDSSDARRVGIYGRFCRNHRFEAVDGVFAETRAAIGVDRWERLVEDYFQAHPMTHFELNENGAGLPEFLVERAEAAGLAAWVPELADLEWWEWQTRIAPDDPSDARDDGAFLAREARGPSAGSGRALHIASTVELRLYGHDLVAWLEAPRGERAAAPEACDIVVVFWRDRDLDIRREEASPLELALLKTIYEGRDPVLLGDAGFGADEVAEAVADLRDAGIIRGGA